MNKLIKYFNKMELLSDFRLASNLGCAILVFLFITPFSINNFIQHSLLLGCITISVSIVSAFIIVAMFMGRYKPIIGFLGLTPFILGTIFLATINQGVIGVLWAFPSILVFYFLLSEKQAWVANTILILIGFPLQIIYLEKSIALRSIITIILVSFISAVFIRVISYQQKRLTATKEKAEYANKAKSEFLANMSHELRTPLNAILGFSQMMKRNPGVTSDQLNNLNTIGRSGEHLLSLINDVLEFSKIEVGRTVLNLENFDLHRMLIGLKEMFQLRAQQNGLYLNIYQDPDIPRYIITDQSKLRQILINLLSNAVKFTKSGEITLSIKKNVQISLKDNISCFLHFEVIDTGMGISLDVQSKIFEAFFQADNKHTQQQGTGLGLPISKKFAELMGGDLTVNSSLNKGSKFTLLLPVKICNKNDLIAHKYFQKVIGIEKGQPPYRLLVVEDNEINRNLLVSLLISVGFDVKEAENGKAAIEIWEKWHPQLVWMDIRMPVMDGYEAINYIVKKTKEKGGRYASKIIGLTANAFEEDRKKILQYGGVDFVRKPFQESEIFEMLEKHINVKFVYEEGKAPELKNKEISYDILKNSLDNIPQQLKTELKEAAELCDALIISKTIKKIQHKNSDLADNLNLLAENFAYDKIISILNNN